MPSPPRSSTLAGSSPEATSIAGSTADSVGPRSAAPTTLGLHSHDIRTMTISAQEGASWAVPTRRAAAWYRLRVWGHVVLRFLRNLRGPAVQRHPPSTRLKEAAVVAESRTPLWRDGRDDELLLIAGKVENLRVARSAFDGIVVPAGSVLSFWRQLGRPSRRRGFVQGREIRAGCVVPTIAGGLCQLSNALAACALDAGLTLVERHGHTARVERTACSDTVDATVFWNYVDLRLVAEFDFRIEVELTSDELVVLIRAVEASRPSVPETSRRISIASPAPSRPVARGCLTCDETECFRHRERAAMPSGRSTAVLVNAWTPEFANHLHAFEGGADWFLPWVRPARRRAGWWAPRAERQGAVAWVASLRRTLLLRRQGGEGGGRQAAVLQGDRWLAESYARRLEPRHTHLLVDQSLLVPLAQAGVLGGRSYDVLMQALPVGELQRRLDAAARHWPHAESLRDFRVGEAYCSAEVEALRRARRLVTPHADVARHLQVAFGGALVESIDWVMPRPASQRSGREPGVPPLVVFPASALARKGAHEMAEAVRRLGWRLLVLGTPSSDPRLWEGVDVSHAGYRDPAWLARADVVALPAFVEHSPQALLKAIAHGIPAVVSPECGLPSSLGVIEVAPGDVASLIAALRRALEVASTEGRMRPQDGAPC